jgi:hypothetical protein
MSVKSTRFIPLLLGLAWVLVSTPAGARDGTLGIYFDDGARECTGQVPTASTRTLHVVLLAEGATFDGITGVEFRVEALPNAPFLVTGASAPSAQILLGNPLLEGCNIAWGSCQRGTRIPIMTFQVYSTGQPARDVPIRIVARLTPQNPRFACPLAVQCDTGTWTSVCIVGAAAILNPSGTQPCDATRIESQWSRMKDLYRP